MCTMKYTAVFLMLWAYISVVVPRHHGLYQIPTDKKSISVSSMVNDAANGCCGVEGSRSFKVMVCLFYGLFVTLFS